MERLDNLSRICIYDSIERAENPEQSLVGWGGGGGGGWEIIPKPVKLNFEAKLGCIVISM